MDPKDPAVEKIKESIAIWNNIEKLLSEGKTGEVDTILINFDFETRSWVESLGVASMTQNFKEELFARKFFLDKLRATISRALDQKYADELVNNLM